MAGRKAPTPSLSGMGGPLDADMRRRVEAARIARLATVRPDGRPHIVPITFALDGETIVTAVDHKPKTTSSLQRLRNIESHPAVSVIIDHYDDDWSGLWWARADGTARIRGQPDLHDRAVTLLVEKYPQYHEHPPLGPLIVVAVETWTSWST